MSSTTAHTAEAESRGIKRGAEVVVDAQGALGNAANKVANTATAAYGTVAAQASVVAEVVKASANSALETVQEKTAAALAVAKENYNVAAEKTSEVLAVAKEKTNQTVEAMKESSVKTLENMKEGYAENAEIVKKNVNHAVEVVKENYNAALEKTTETLTTMKEAAKDQTNHAVADIKEGTAESKVIVQKNVEIAKEKVIEQVHKGQEGAAYVKGVSEGVVGVAAGTHAVSRPIDGAPVVESPPPMAESGINMAKAQELSESFSNKTMDANM